MIIVGSRAPDFIAEAAVNGARSSISLDLYRGRYVLLFFYPADFSVVCPSELHALQRHLSAFGGRNVEVLAVSVDSVYTHLAWLRTPVHEGGIEGTTFALVSDMSHAISRSWGVLDEDSGSSLRGVFVIDPEGTVQYGSLNALAFGRSVQELLRVIDGIQFAATNGVVCPANWKPGDLSLSAREENRGAFFARWSRTT